MTKDVMLVTGAGQISMAIARRMGYGKKIVLGDRSIDNAKAIAKTLTEAGFDVVTFEMDLSSRQSIKEMIAYAQTFGDIKYLVNGAGVSPSQASIATVLKVDLYGTSVLLEEVGKVIAKGGAGVTISSQSGHRMPALTAEQDLALAMTLTEELLTLDFLQEDKIENSLHAYQLAKRANEKRTMYEAVRWENVVPELTILHQELLLRHLLLTNSMVFEAISTKICLPNHQLDVLGRQMKWQMLLNCS